ncbi:MAG: malate synthase A, partial [Pseudorhodoplanes sp.]|nr:malate synthase A [Pseudorhodoplanes sp.]
IWQWLKYGATLSNGRKVTPAFFRKALKEEMQRVKAELGVQVYSRSRFPEAIRLFSRLSLSKNFAEFLTLPAYRLIK